jgi:DNA-binding transcriptional ArsR family regulator
MVAYSSDMDQIFKALADVTRRDLLDRLFEHDGQTLSALCEQQGCSRQAVSKHLGVLQDAGLVAVHWQGREKLHYLNPVPIQTIADRWIHKYRCRQVQAVADLKKALENETGEEES